MARAQTKGVPAAFVEALKEALGPDAVLTSRRDLEVYSYDATLRHSLPDAVVLPQSTDQVAAVVRLCRRFEVPVVPRGSATSLSGGPVPVRGGVVMALTRMNRILEIDEANLRAVVQPGLINADLNDAVAARGLMYAPDPASQLACSMGGNVAENAGGPHCLKYGVTANHVTGLTAVTADGEVVRLGGKALAWPGLDLRGLVIGSEGTLAIVTEIVCRLLPDPPARVTMLACFNTINDASRAVSEVIAAGLLPATIEMIDRTVIEAVEMYESLGYPRDVEAVLVIEIDGLAAALPPQVEQVQEICRRCGATRFEWADSDEQRERLWRGRKGATAALAVIAPAKLSTDVTVPRSRLPEALAEVAEISRRFNIPIGNVFHAGDGNLHPQVLFDPRDQEQMARAIAADEAITEMALRYGGVLTGEHGIGSEKRKYMTRAFGRLELEAMWAAKEAFDSAGLLNPDKVLPDRSEVQALRAAVPAAVLAVSPGQVSVRSPADVAEALASCAKAGIRAHCSAQSRLPTDAAEVDIVLNAADVLDYDADNLTVTVAAGMSVGELQSILAAHGQAASAWRCLPPDITLGALAALAWPTPSCPRHGLPRDFILGITVATARGCMAFGSSCVKNVAGYAIERLFIGNCCTLGVITALTLRTFPLPQHELTLTAHMPLDALSAVSAWLARQPLAVDWVRARPAGEHWHVAIALAGYREEVDEAASTIREQLQRTGAGMSEDAGGAWTPPLPHDEIFAIATAPAEACQLAAQLSAVEVWPLAGIIWTQTPPAQLPPDAHVLSLSASRVLTDSALPDTVRKLKDHFDPANVLPPWPAA